MVLITTFRPLSTGLPHWQTEQRPALRGWNVAFNNKMTTLTQTMIEPFHRQITMYIIYFFKLLSSFFCLYNRSTWQRVSAVRLFIEHTYPGSSACHPADVGNAFKLWKVRINLVLKILSCSSPGDEWENSLETRLGENRRSRCILVCPKCKYASHFNQSLETSRSVPLSCKHWGFTSDSCH